MGKRRNRRSRAPSKRRSMPKKRAYRKKSWQKKSTAARTQHIKPRPEPLGTPIKGICPSKEEIRNPSPAINTRRSRSPSPRPERKAVNDWTCDYCHVKMDEVDPDSNYAVLSSTTNEDGQQFRCAECVEWYGLDTRSKYSSADIDIWESYYGGPEPEVDSDDSDHFECRTSNWFICEEDRGWVCEICFHDVKSPTSLAGTGFQPDGSFISPLSVYRGGCFPARCEECAERIRKESVHHPYSPADIDYDF